MNVVRYKPDGIEALARTTKFSKKELQLIYRGFKAECPNGFVSEETFKGIYSQFFPQGDATAYAHFVFNAFDVEQQGSISFEEFVTILSELSRGSVAEKLRWAFNLYDINGDGCITKEELQDIVTAVYSLVGRNATPAVEENTTQEHVDRIFEVGRFQDPTFPTGEPLEASIHCLCPASPPCTFLAPLAPSEPAFPFAPAGRDHRQLAHHPRHELLTRGPAQCRRLAAGPQLQHVEAAPSGCRASGGATGTGHGRGGVKGHEGTLGSAPWRDCCVEFPGEGREA
ncbi:Kv channel-interacting protein 1-like [Penaeus japonicus]|uniref:Kv channel-interacting protein 1-like n=1 Tax=Penaeus japonicus TaxID=27405 RepID=UPI001C71657A|nr:Kv channel-interacting protein 1-like [Penaeus japonicus]